MPEVANAALRHACLALLVLLPITSIAQTISGRVYDPDGRVVSDARVLLMQDYVKQKETNSDSAGEFAFSGLQPGMYQLQIKQQRFSLFQQTVMIGKEPARIHAVLPIARETEAVQISGSLPASGHKVARRENDIPRPGGQIEPAEILQPIRPAYPGNARMRGAEGAVVLYATIRTDGSVADPIVLESPDIDLEKEALRSIGTLQYRPMKLNGHPVQCQVTIVLDFKLE